MTSTKTSFPVANVARGIKIDLGQDEFLILECLGMRVGEPTPEAALVILKEIKTSYGNVKIDGQFSLVYYESLIQKGVILSPVEWSKILALYAAQSGVMGEA